MTERLVRRDFLRSGGGIAGAMLGPLGCCPCRVGTTETWNNAVNTSGVSPELFATPKSLIELVQLVKQAEVNGMGIKMTGSGHSFSDVALSEDYLLSPQGLNKPLDLPRVQLRGPFKDDPYLVRVQSGMQLRTLNPWLFEQGLALRNMGGYDAQTVVGASITGTHGSGLAYGPIASQVLSMQVVSIGGSVLQVEPTNGITDPASFPGFIETPEGRIPALLEQNDETFNALSVSLGCMGIVYAVILQVEPRYWLKEVRQKTTWGALKRPDGFLSRVLSGRRLELNEPEDPAYYEIYFNPYPPKRHASADQHSCIVTKRYKLRERPKHLTPADRKRGRYGNELLTTALRLSDQGKAVVDYLNSYPADAPLFIEGSLAVLEDKSYVGVSYDVFNLGAPNRARVYGIEMAFDLQQTVQATERVFQLAAELKDDDCVHSAPPSLRFVRQSDAHLAMMNGRNTTMLEMGILVCSNGAEKLMETYEETFVEEMQARPHWGLDMNFLQSFEQVRRLYPNSADRWLAVYNRFNQRGTFNGEFTDRLGISINV